MQPVFIQWTASADPAALLNATELHDGWYIIDSFEPNYERFVISGLVQCRMTVTFVAPAAPRRFALWYSGAALSSNYSGAGTNLLSLPVGSTAMEANFTRTGAEGAIPCILSPAASPEPVVLSTTLANYYKGGVHVYDTINTSSNPVPVAGGTFVHANWVEVFGTDHDFVGDCVITNGLQLLLFQVGQTQIATCYLWNIALAVANWQQYATLNYFDENARNATLQSYSPQRVGAEECSLGPIATTGVAPNTALPAIRLQRGRYEVRTDFRPLTQVVTSSSRLTLTLIATHKILYNSTKVADNVLSETAPAPTTDYGYGAAFIANSADPFIAGWLYQNAPTTAQPGDSLNTASLRVGDTNSLAINAQRSYGFFAIPYGVSGSYSTANLQAEAESGTLGTGWTSQANAAASAGNEAKCASGTSAAANADLWGGTVLAVGTYKAWFRVKVLSAASAVVQMLFGVWDATGANWANTGTYLTASLAPNAFTTSYAWYNLSLGAFTPIAGRTYQFRVQTSTNALDTDWFIDEAVFAPLTLTTDNRGPQDLYSQFRYDRSVRWTRS